jgi:NitT/TauT family transport system substrate-binding protein
MKYFSSCVNLLFLFSIFFIGSKSHAVDSSLNTKASFTLAGPGAVVSYPLMVMAQKDMLSQQQIELEFVQWKNPQQLRAMVMGGQVDFTAMPSNLAATFYNRGHQLSLINISIWDIMSIVSQQGYRLNGLEDLVGQKIVVPFKNDMTSILLKELLNANLADKVNLVSIRNSHNLADAAQLLLANKVKHALLIEPLSSVVLYQANKNNAKKSAVNLVTSLNISQLWQRSFPNSPKLPQAGIVANTTVNQDAKLVEQVNQAYKKSAVWCQANVRECADIVRIYLPKMPREALISAIEKTAITTVDAKLAKKDLESFYRLLAKSDAKRIGGKLPAAGFYF